MADLSQRALIAAKLRVATMVLQLALIAFVIAWTGAPQWTGRQWLLGLALTLPLWLTLPGLWRAHRRAFAATTLCAIPYLVIGTTEAVARPHARAWAAMCLTLSLLLFVTPIGYLRVTRETGG